jgi:hypothetical protein
LWQGMLMTWLSMCSGRSLSIPFPNISPFDVTLYPSFW